MKNEITYWIKSELYPAVFQIADRAFPEHNFRHNSRGWISNTYLDGSKHKMRKDKTVISKKEPGRILEQGGENLTLVDYVMKRDGVEFIESVKILASVAGVMVPGQDNFEFQSTSYKPPIRFEKPDDFDFHDYQDVTDSARQYKNNNFIQSLRGLFPDEDIQIMILDYLIGTSRRWNGANIFWQIDQHNRVRFGQVMLYDVKTAKRNPKCNDSVNNILKLKDFRIKQCLFGLHLLNSRKERTIAIVEAPKTAAIMSMYQKEYIWMATINQKGFNKERLLPLLAYKIVAFPDKGVFDEWSAIAFELNQEGFDITVSDLIERKESYGKGADLADLILDEMRTGLVIPTSEEKAAEPAEMILTNLEYNIQKLGHKNPALFKLIEAFDLVDENTDSLRFTVI